MSEVLVSPQARLGQLFRFLQAFNEYQYPVTKRLSDQLWTLWLEKLPSYQTIEVGPIDTVDTDVDVSCIILRVRRPELTNPPEPPVTLRAWLEPGWEKIDQAVSVHEEILIPSANGEPTPERFEDNSERVAMFKDWSHSRDLWVETETIARSAMQVFGDIYELYGRLQRESESVELILGDGHLAWNDVLHPVLLKRLNLRFNPTIPEFIFAETDDASEIYGGLFNGIPDVDGQALAACREELQQADFHPLGGGDTTAFLRRLVAQLSPQGRLVELVGSGAGLGPTISRNPVVFLRKRTSGYAQAIANILEDLSTRENDFSAALLSIAGLDPAADRVGEDGEPELPVDHKQVDVLFAKPANPEQFQIAERLEHHAGVIVQGPPGTGKTHTIANLLGHLLAQGKQVLVTSHTTKALRVLRDKVVEPLKPLCVSVLDTDTESRTQLEASVHAIAAQLNTDQNRLIHEIQALSEMRSHLLQDIDELDRKLLEARSGEYRAITVAGETCYPANAAREVARDREDYGWIPGPVVPGVLAPLSPVELADLYATNRSVDPEDEVKIGQKLPAPESLPSPEEFAQMVRTKQTLQSGDIEYESGLWETSTGTDPQTLESLVRKVTEAISVLDFSQIWELDVLEAGKSDLGRRPWETLLGMIESVIAEALKTRDIVLQYGPTTTRTTDLDEQLRIVEEITKHLDRGGKLGFFDLVLRGDWKGALPLWKVSGKAPTRHEHFHAIKGFLSLAIHRHELSERWNRQMVPLGAPGAEDDGSSVETTFVSYVEPIKRLLGWYKDIWIPVLNEIRTLGFRWEELLGRQHSEAGPYSETLRLKNVADALLKAIAARAQWLRLASIKTDFETLSHQLAEMNNMSGVTNTLQNAVGRLSLETYQVAYEELVRLTRLRSPLSRRQQLLEKLEESAPGWAAAIKGRLDVHGEVEPPGDVNKAWVWRQLNDELDRRTHISINELQDGKERIEEQIRQVTADLIERKASLGQIRNTTNRQRQALVGYVDLVRRIGKRKGKRVPQLLNQARLQMIECRGAVPVWIMPLSRVVETFDPKTTRFDVVILDEASQSDLRGLVALYMAKKVVIVGDHEQVSPDSVGLEADFIQRLIDEHLQEIPNRILYDGQASIYDLGRQSFGGIIALTEHFRCVPEIIEFSNRLSYNGRIQPLRDASTVLTKPHVIPYRVNGSRRGHVNSGEALVIASLIAAAVEQPEYEGKTFGVIALVGNEQAYEIDRLLRTYLSPEEYQRRKVLCGKPAQFQGDERDVVFLSMVDQPDEGPLAMRADERFKKRYNVAASRAADQLWVVYSIDPRVDLKPEDLRRRLIEHAEDPMALTRAVSYLEEQTQSEFERLVLHRLVSAGFRVTPQKQVGHYFIDLVVEGGSNQLAVECDGDRYHPLEKLDEDMGRQANLERMGWRFVRIRGSQFFREPDAAMRTVFEKLRSLGIEPEGLDKEAQPMAESDIKDRVIRRATEFRSEWLAQDGTLPVGLSVPPEEALVQNHEGESNTNILDLETALGARSSRSSKVAIPDRMKMPTPAVPVDSREVQSRQQEPGMPTEEDNEIVSWMSSTDPGYWFGAARWTKENGYLEGWERKLLFGIGQLVAKGKGPSVRQLRHAKRLHDILLTLGYRQN